VLSDPGARQVLRRVERARAEEVLRMKWLTEGLMTLFASDRPVVRGLRNAGLRFCNALPFVKTLMVRQAAQH
jgi:2-polyprenyl-6-methoxyphenol hydroxylase-like FAD-dependent oxidoreductase